MKRAILVVVLLAFVASNALLLRTVFWSPEREVKAGTFTLVGPNGRERGYFHVWEDVNPILALKDFENHNRIALYYREDGAARFQMSDGRSWPSRVVLASEPETAYLELRDASNATRIRLAVGADGEARIEVLDERGEIVWSAP